MRMKDLLATRILMASDEPRCPYSLWVFVSLRVRLARENGVVSIL
jgi:hypothetical protein